jgi:hypothetical protein
MNLTSWADVSMAAMAVLGLIGAVVMKVYKRGGADRALSDTVASLKVALEDNTKSNNDLASELKDFKLDTLDQLHKMDKRVTLLESK